MDDALGGNFQPAVQARRSGSAGTAPLADKEHQVAPGVLAGAEDGLGHGAGSVVDGDEQRQLRLSVLQPWVLTAVDLHQRPPSWRNRLRRNRCWRKRPRAEAGTRVS